MFKGPGLVFVGERDCKVEEVAIDESSLDPGGVVVEVDVSVISAGTETANFTGLDPGTRVPGSWNYYPYHPGYGAIGNVVAVGPPLPGSPPAAAVGQRVFAICPHARFGVVDTARRPIVPLRADDDARSFVLARMASVSITSVRKASHVQFGANAVVVGLGLVGNFAAQLLQLAGMNVVGLDRIPHRVDMATATGLDAVLVKGGTRPKRSASDWQRVQTSSLRLQAYRTPYPLRSPSPVTGPRSSCSVRRVASTAGMPRRCSPKSTAAASRSSVLSSGCYR